MSRFTFSNAQRYAIWMAWSRTCFYCSEPVSWEALSIDHVVPAHCNSLRRTEVAALMTHLHMMFPEFSLNDYCNWVPAHSACNRAKGAEVYDEKRIVFFLEKVQNKLPKVREQLEKLQKGRSHDRTVSRLEVDIERGAISREDVQNVLDRAAVVEGDDPLVITLGTNMEAISSFEALERFSDMRYWEVCDTLERQLIEILRTSSPYAFYFTEASTRDGECLSVRIVFPELRQRDIAELQLGSLCGSVPWWQVLEVTTFASVYGVQYAESDFLSLWPWHRS